MPQVYRCAAGSVGPRSNRNPTPMCYFFRFHLAARRCQSRRPAMSLPKFSWPSFDPRRLARSKVLWSLGGLLLFYTIAGFFIAPWLIGRNLPAFAQERLGRKASIEKVHINPYALTFEASGFFLENKGDKPLLAFKRLYVNLQLSSLFSAWSFDEVRLEGARLGLEIDRELR